MTRSFPPRPRWLYIAVFSWMVVTGGRFLAPFLEHQAGFSDSLIGTALALQYGIMSILSPIIGSVADTRERLLPHYGRAQVLATGVILGTAIFCLHYPGRIDANSSSTTNESRSMEQNVRSLSPSSSVSWTEWIQTVLLTSWQYHMFIQFLYACIYGAVLPVVDGMTLDYLTQQEEHRRKREATDFLQQHHQQQPMNPDENEEGGTMDYGKERLFGAISWAVFSLIFGPLIDRYGFQVSYPCAIATCIGCLWIVAYYANGQFQHYQLQARDSKEDMAASNITSSLIPNEFSNVDYASTASQSRSTIDQMADRSASPLTSTSSCQLTGKVLFSTIYGAAFVFCYFMLIVGFSVVDTMNFLFFEFLQGSYTTDAISVAISVMFEIPIFQLAPSLLRRHGVGKLLLAANAAYIIRILGYTLIPQGHVAFVFLLEPLHGVTYACSQSSIVEFVQRQMPVGAEASGQGIVSFFRGSASVIGMGMGGIAQDVFGPRTMYRLFAVTVSIGMLLFGVMVVKERSTQVKPRNCQNESVNRHDETMQVNANATFSPEGTL